MTSKLTREELLNIIETDHVQCGEASALARMALAAMGSEPVAIIDQANLDYLRSGADADVWPPEREEMGDVLLYRHPQPAPVVPDDGLIAELLTIAKEAADDADVFAYSEFNNKSMRHSTAIADWERRAAMLNQAQEPATYNTAPQPAVVSDEMIDTFEAEFRSAFKVSPEVKQMLEIGYHGEKFSLSIRDAAILWKLGRAAMLHAGNSPAIQDGYVMVPKEPTPEILAVITEAIKSMRGSAATYARVLAAAPQPQNAPQNIPEIIPGWIPVSERMPPSRHEVLVGCWWGEKPRWCCKWATYIPGHPDAQSSGWLIPGGSWVPTHWQELPAAPQEVK